MRRKAEFCFAFLLLVDILMTMLTETMILFLCNQDLFDFRYISIGDIAHLGSHPPNVAAIYRHVEGMFVPPVGYDLVRNFSQNPCQCFDH